MKTKFNGSQFKATKWDSANDKAEFATKLCDFLFQGCPRGRYSSGFYRRLCQMFGFIAHCDVNGFWQERFSGPEQRLETIKQIAGIGNNLVGVGDPAWTWSDVEKVVQEFVIEQNLPQRFSEELRAIVENEERTKLAELQAKYPDERSTSSRSGTGLGSGPKLAGK